MKNKPGTHIEYQRSVWGHTKVVLCYITVRSVCALYKKEEAEVSIRGFCEFKGKNRECVVASHSSPG